MKRYMFLARISPGIIFCKFEENAPVPEEVVGTNWRALNVL
jgi:hypothetical protein